MPESVFDIVILGAGSGGLTAAAFAAKLGAKTALVEGNKIGGDCTWTGCVPSKALLKAAKVAHAVRGAGRFGVTAPPPATDMRRVRDYVHSAIAEVYRNETPERLARAGIEVVQGRGEFLDSRSIRAGGRTLLGKTFLVTTGAQPALPPIRGLAGVPFITYEQIFDNDRLPEKLGIIGGGPIGVEMAQAYRRLGSQVTVIDREFLPRDEPEARETLRTVLEAEGIRFIRDFASSVRTGSGGVVVETPAGNEACDLLLVAAGRAPRVEGLGLDRAGVDYSAKGITVDDRLRTSQKHIYAAGDVLGREQFTHLAGWQAFQAVRNALLPGGGSGFSNLVPWVTYTDPEVGHIGLTEEQARGAFGGRVRVHVRRMNDVDRAIAEGGAEGLVKVVTKDGDTIVGATIVAARAGEMVAELALAIRNRLGLKELAATIHPYPTYSTAIQQLAAEATIERTLGGASGPLIRGLSRLVR